MIDPTPVHLILLALFAGLMGLAAACDIDSLRIPNRLVAALVLLYPVYVLASPSPVDWTGALAMAAAALVVGFLVWRFGWLGAGDAKLLAAALLWVGPTAALTLLLIMGLAGGVLALVIATDLRFAAANLVRGLLHNSGEAFMRQEVPYGVAIAAGAFVAVVQLTTT